MQSTAPPTTGVTTITIVLADDHPMVRSALRYLLETPEDFDVVAEADDAESALQSVLRDRPAVLVLDLTMPGWLSPLEALPQLREQAPETAVVVLTMQSDPGFARRALRDGARAYVLKEAADEELLEAVRRVTAGETYVAAGLCESADEPEAAVRRGELTPRELEVLRLIGLRHTNDEIAALLTLSVRTVESHCAHIHRKLGCSRRADLVRYAIVQRLVVT